MVFKKESFGLDAPTSKLWDTAELEYDSDESTGEPDPLHPEDWQDWYSEELLFAWEKIREIIDENYLRNTATYHTFVEFVMDPFKPSSFNPPSHVASTLWNKICTIPVIRMNVVREGFYYWIEQNIDCNINV